MSDVYVNSEGLKSIALGIEQKRAAINDLYKTKVVQLLNRSKEDLKVSGLNYDELYSSFDTLFSSLDNRLNELVNILVNVVIPKYGQVCDSIVKMFNNDFANSMNDIIATMNQK